MELYKLLADYIEIKRGEGISPKTLTMYKLHISRFIASLPATHRCLSTFTIADVAAFIAAEEERGIVATTRRSEHRAIDIWLNWLSDRDEYGNPPNKLRRLDGRLKLKPPRKPKHQPRRADINDLKHVVDCIPMSEWIGLRDRAMLLLALDSGLRIGELCALDIDDIDVSKRTVHVHSGKQQKERISLFTEGTATALSLYIMARPPVPPLLDWSNHLFLSAYVALDIGPRGPLTVIGAQQRLRQHCQTANVRHINWHSIRHLFGTKAVNDGMRMEVISLLMGHADISFTRRVYAELLPASAIDEYRQKWKY